MLIELHSPASPKWPSLLLLPPAPTTILYRPLFLSQMYLYCIIYPFPYLTCSLSPSVRFSIRPSLSFGPSFSASFKHLPWTSSFRWHQVFAVRNSAFSMDLKRIQTPHRFSWGLGADKTSTIHWSGGRVQVWVQVWAPAGHLVITPESCSRRQSKVLTAKAMAELLGPRSGSALAGLTGEHKRRAFPSRRQSLRAATGSLQEKTLYHSCDTDSVRESKRL